MSVSHLLGEGGQIPDLLNKSGISQIRKINGWVVERTYVGLNWCRRLSKDYERLPKTSETFIYIAMIRVMVRRLA